MNQEYATAFEKTYHMQQAQRTQQALCQPNALIQQVRENLDVKQEKEPCSDDDDDDLEDLDEYRFSCSVCDDYASFLTRPNYSTKHVLWARSLSPGQIVDYRRNAHSFWQSAWVAWVLQPGVYVMALAMGNGVRQHDGARGNLTTTQSTETIAGCDTLSPAGWHTHSCPQA